MNASNHYHRFLHHPLSTLSFLLLYLLSPDLIRSPMHQTLTITDRTTNRIAHRLHMISHRTRWKACTLLRVDMLCLRRRHDCPMQMLAWRIRQPTLPQHRDFLLQLSILHLQLSNQIAALCNDLTIMHESGVLVTELVALGDERIICRPVPLTIDIRALEDWRLAVLDVDALACDLSTELEVLVLGIWEVCGSTTVDDDDGVAVSHSGAREFLVAT
jgi:hypothetical protein